FALALNLDKKLY
ncbi:unnamed protein product, partial [Cuscuta campestris]